MLKSHVICMRTSHNRRAKVSLRLSGSVNPGVVLSVVRSFGCVCSAYLARSQNCLQLIKTTKHIVSTDRNLNLYQQFSLRSMKGVRRWCESGASVMTTTTTTVEGSNKRLIFVCRDPCSIQRSLRCRQPTSTGPSVLCSRHAWNKRLNTIITAGQNSISWPFRQWLRMYILLTNTYYAYLMKPFSNAVRRLQSALVPIQIRRQTSDFFAPNRWRQGREPFRMRLNLH